MCLTGSRPVLAQSSQGTVASQAETQATIEKVVGCLPPPVIVKGETPPCRTLSKRMADLHIPGVSIAVIHHGAIEWARGYGVRQLSGSPVTTDTIFQAGSISKAVAALAALRLVQNGKLSLDSNVNDTLTSWKVPPSQAAPGATVTLRELLTHTAGFTVHGFPGYAAHTPVPTLVQILDGQSPANTPPIRLESVPGSKWNYSGGGFTVMQEVVLNVVKQPFPQLLHDTVLAPIGMTHSTYQQPLPDELLDTAAMPYTAEGTAVPGGPHTYPEMAAAGLWTTPSDLGRYIMEVQQSLQGHANHVLSQNLTRQMLTPGKGNWGLGLEIGGSTAKPYFSHGGVNEGYESLLAAYEHEGDGAVVMTNAQGGSNLASEVMSSIAVAYNWPNFHPAVRTQIKLSPAVLARYVGAFQITPQFILSFALEGDELTTQATNQPKLPIYPESNTKFFLKVVDAEVEFFLDEKGQVSYLVLHQNGQEIKAMKK